MKILQLLAGTALLSAAAVVAPAQTPGGYGAPAHDSGYGTTSPAHPAGYDSASDHAGYSPAGGPPDLPPDARPLLCPPGGADQDRTL